MEVTFVTYHKLFESTMNTVLSLRSREYEMRSVLLSQCSVTGARYPSAR